MTREEARTIASIALERALKQRGGSQAEEDCIADAILAAVAAERDRENAWLRRLLTWCAARLRYDCYRESLARYIAAGPTDPDATPIGHSNRQPEPPEKAP
jgi:hypothetical protein